MSTFLGGRMILKSVSLFLASGRRASGGRRRAAAEEEKQKQRKRGGARMEPDARNANKLPPKQLEALKRRTHFNKLELEALFVMYRKMIVASMPARKVAMAIKSSGTGISKTNVSIEGIDRTMFRELLHTTFDLVAEETLAERIWCVWEGSGAATSTGSLRLEPWLMGLSVFLKGTFNEKMAYCFKVYDLNTDGFITKDEMFILLRNSLLKQPGDEDPDESVKELVELVLKKIDIDQDGKISFDDYKKTVTKEPLLLEAFGQCLPGNTECVAFLESLQQQ